MAAPDAAFAADVATALLKCTGTHADALTTALGAVILLAAARPEAAEACFAIALDTIQRGRARAAEHRTAGSVVTS